MASFTPVGVEAVVKGISKFNQDMGKMGQSMGGFGKVANSVATGALRRVGEGIANFAARLPQMAVELVKLGAAAERQANALDSMAKSFGTSGDAIVESIQRASGFTIDSMTAMQAANRAMLLDVAKAPNEFERLTKVAVRLGRVMGLDATQSINDFVTAAGRQSIMIADNLGLTIKVGDANEIYARQLGVTANELTKAQQKQAFLNAMLDAGEEKLGALGDEVGDTATGIEKLEAVLVDAKTGLAGMVAETADAIINFDKLADTIRNLQSSLGLQAQAFGAAEAAWITGGDAIAAYDRTLAILEGSMAASTHEAARLAATGRSVTDAAMETTAAVGAWEQGISDVIIPTVQATSAWETFGLAVGGTIPTVDEYVASLEDTQRALVGVVISQTQLNEKLFDVSGTEIAKVAISELNMLLQAGSLTTDQYNIAVTQLQLTFGLTSEQVIGFRESLAILNEQLVAGNITAAEYDEALLLLTEDLPPTTRETEELARAMDEAAREADKLTLETERTAAMAGDTFVEAAGDAIVETDTWSLALFEAADAAGADAQELALLAAGLGIYTDEQIEAALATVALSTTIDELGTAIANGSLTVAEAIFELRKQVDMMNFSIGVTNRSASAARGASRATRDNTKARRKATEKAREQARVERELAEVERELERALAKTGDQLVDVLSSMEVATEEADAWALALFEAADAAGADATELATLAGALGLYTQEQLEAALAAAAMQEKLEELGTEIAAGLGIDEALAKFNEFRELLLPSVEADLDATAGGQVSESPVSSTSPYFQIGPNSIAGGMDQAVFEERVRQTVAGALP